MSHFVACYLALHCLSITFYGSPVKKGLKMVSLHRPWKQTGIQCCLPQKKTQPNIHVNFRCIERHSQKYIHVKAWCIEVHTRQGQVYRSTSTSIVVVVVVLLFYVHGKNLRSCRDGQLT